MAPILIATATATAPAQQQQQQVENKPRPFKRDWDPKWPISDIMTTDVPPMLPGRKINPVIVPVMSPAPVPVEGSLLQAPPSPELSAPGPSETPGPSTVPKSSVTPTPPPIPRLNARGRKLLPDGPTKRRAQTSSTPQNGAQSSISAPKQRAGLVSAATPAPAAIQLIAQPAVVAVVSQKSKLKRENEKVRCTCSYCVEKHGPSGKMIAEKTWKEHKRADTTAKEGTVQDPKCKKCQKQGYVCIRKETGPCQVCMRMSDVCSFTGDSQRKREVARRERQKEKKKKVANTVTGTPADPATQHEKQKQGHVPSSQNGKDDGQVPDLPVGSGQQAEQSIFEDNVEDVGENGSHASRSSGLGLRSRTLSISPPPVVRKRSDEVDEDVGGDSGPRAKRRRIAVDKTD
ncbi:hypothetical protein COL5a_004611 [Colletotrichum fioriniae]|nr:hypothetical protein COL5a_004611 [Colletotrichum fioriniae]